MRLKKTKIKLLEDMWTVQIVSDTHLADIEQDYSLPGSDAIMVPDERAIYVSMSSVDLETIMHEVTHVYWAATCTQSARTISPEDYEEIVCEFLPKFGEKIIALSKQILKRLK